MRAMDPFRPSHEWSILVMSLFPSSALANGWQIGSGPTDATCKALTARLKGPGMRWDADNAEAIVALEALTQNGQWDLYWQSQLRPTG